MMIIDDSNVEELDWMGHKQLGHAGSTDPTAHCHQLLFKRPEHKSEYNYCRNFIENNASYKYKKMISWARRFEPLRLGFLTV